MIVCVCDHVSVHIHSPMWPCVHMCVRKSQHSRPHLHSGTPATNSWETPAGKGNPRGKVPLTSRGRPWTLGREVDVTCLGFIS
jgi:hypothetical protein